MILPDVNVLVDAQRSDSPHHEPVARWLMETVESGRSMLLADVVVAGFLRIVTHPRVFLDPSPQAEAIAFLEGLVEQPSFRLVGATARHWPVFRDVLVRADARGTLVSDAHVAAVALQHGATVVTRDRDFARFDGVRWFDPTATT